VVRAAAERDAITASFCFAFRKEVRATTLAVRGVPFVQVQIAGGAVVTQLVADRNRADQLQEQRHAKHHHHDGQPPADRSLHRDVAEPGGRQRAQREVQGIEIVHDLRVLAVLVDIDERSHDEDEDDKVHHLGNDKRVVVQPLRRNVLAIQELERPYQPHDTEDAEKHHVLRNERHQQCCGDNQIGEVGDAQEETRLVAFDVEPGGEVQRDDQGDEDVDGDPYPGRQDILPMPGNRRMEQEEHD
jgi:hypothetical protein